MPEFFLFVSGLGFGIAVMAYLWKRECTSLPVILSNLEPYFDFIYDNEKEFLKYFFEGVEIVSVYMSVEDIEVVYATANGAHVVDVISVEEFLRWRDNL